jgi:hypothetical protein
MFYLYYVNASEIGPELFADHGTAGVSGIHVHVDLFAVADGPDL